MRIARGKNSIGRRQPAILCGLVLVLTLGLASTGHGQTTTAPAETIVAPLLWKEDPIGQGVNLPMPCAPYQDENGPLLIGHPLLDGGATGLPGWVAGAEVGVVVPHIMNRLSDSVTRTSGATDTVQLPSAQISAAVMPRFDLGYRFGQSTGEVLLSYRFLTGAATDFASGNVVPAFGPGRANVSRLNLNTWDLDYGSCEPITVLGVSMKWRLGIRTLLEYNDSQASNSTLSQSTSNFYFGAGPHAMVDFRRPIQGTDLELFGRIEAAYMWGVLNQNFSETVTTAGVADSGENFNHLYSQVTSLAVQAGLTWSPQWCPGFHVTGGYIFEHFWDLGTSATGNAAREELDLNGGFVRVEWNY